jgi:hypothetical protein
MIGPSIGDIYDSEFPETHKLQAAQPVVEKAIPNPNLSRQVNKMICGANAFGGLSSRSRTLVFDTVAQGAVR